MPSRATVPWSGAVGAWQSEVDHRNKKFNEKSRQFLAYKNVYWLWGADEKAVTRVTVRHYDAYLQWQNFQFNPYNHNMYFPLILAFILVGVGLAVEYSSCFISVLNLDLYVCCFDAYILVRNPSRGPNNLYIYELQKNIGRGLLQRKTGKYLKTWLSICAVWLYAVLIFCSFSVRFLGKEVQFDSIGSQSLPFHLLYAPLSELLLTLLRRCFCCGLF